MKIEKQDITPAFMPVTVILQTKEEFNKLYEMMNCIHEGECDAIARRGDHRISGEEFKIFAHDLWKIMQRVK